MDCQRPRQENVLPSAAFLLNEDSESVKNTYNLARLRKSWNKFNLKQNGTAIEKTCLGSLIKELEEIKVWIKLLLEIK